jgi:trigger factor
MNIAELKNDKTEFHAKVTIPVNSITGEIDQELKGIAKTAKMDGFRVGKVPTHILKKKYASSIRADIVRKKINSTIDELIKKNNLNIAMDPAIEDLENEDDKDLAFTLKFELLPEIKLPEFKKIAIEKPVMEVSEKDINEQINRIAEFSKTYEKESKGKAVSGDQLTIDAVGYVDGKAFEGGKLEGHKLVLGSNTFIPGFEDQLIGSKVGDDVKVKVTFPEEYHAENLAGKPSEFKVQVKAVHKAITPKIDDEFAKKFKCDTLEKLKEQIKENLSTSYQEPIHILMKMNLFDQLENMLKFEVPKSLIEREISILEKQSDQFAELDLNKKSDKEKAKYFEKLAARRVRIGLVLAEYVKQKNLKITEDDVRQAIIAQARNYPGQEKQVIEFYQKDRQALEALKGPILEEKGVKEIFDNEIIINEKSYSKDKLEELLEKEVK